MTLLGVVDNLVENGGSSSSPTKTKTDLKKEEEEPQTSPTRDINNGVHPKSAEDPVASQETTPPVDDEEYNYPGRYAPIREDPDQPLVMTPYGRGMVTRTRTNPRTLKVVSRHVELIDWKTAAPKKGGPPRPVMLYTPLEFPSVALEVGHDVTCQFGRGKVLQRLPDTNQVKVELSSWRLAGRSKVTCFLATDKVQVVRAKRVYEMSVFERVEHAQYLKEQAKQAFVRKEYERALTKYALAIDAVRYVQHDKTSTNYLRADLLVVMITCCNNAATCAAQQHHWDMVIKYAKNALVLIDALQERQSPNKKPTKIMELLIKDGNDSVKMFGEWKGKSILFLARAAQAQQNYAKALDYCKTAHDIVVTYSKQDPSNKVLLQQGKEIARIHAASKEGKQKLLKKEKQRAQAMFGGNSSNSSTGSPTKSNGDKTTNGTGSPSNKMETNGTPSPATSPKRSSLLSHNSSNGNTSNRSLMMDDRSTRSVHFEDGGKPSDEYENSNSTRRISRTNNHDEDEDEDDEEEYDGMEEMEVPWYQEHQELMILVGGMALMGVAVTQLMQKRSR